MSKVKPPKRIWVSWESDVSNYLGVNEVGVVWKKGTFRYAGRPNDVTAEYVLKTKKRKKVGA